MPGIERKEFLTVPVIVDDPAGEGVAALDRLVRCVYFSIDAIRPAPNWTLNLADRQIPFFMFGLSGIIFMPAQTDEVEFRNQDDVDRTFNTIEASGDLLVETSHILLPYTLLSDRLRDRELQAEDAFRVRHDLFISALAFKQCRLSQNEFTEGIGAVQAELSQIAPEPGRPLPIRFSPEEGRAFHDWSVERMAEARRQLNDWISEGLTHPQRNDRRRRF